MDVTITQFRRDLFKLVEQALNGVQVHVTHKGRSFTLTPDEPVDPTKRWRLTIPKASGNSLRTHPMTVVIDRLLSVTLVAGLLAVSGCKSSTTASPSSSASGDAASSGQPPAAAAPVNPATAGTVTGTVNLKGTPPPRVKIDMSMDPACSLSADDNLTEQFVVNHGPLGNVFVYIKAGLPASSAPAGTPPVHIDQKGCRFIPHVAAVQQGGSVAFTNSDPTMHNVHTMTTTVGNSNVDVSQGPGSSPQVRRFNGVEVMLPIRCNNHPWMQGFLNVAPNPYFAVTGPDGSFSIPNLPPGTYTLAAVHEKLGEQDTQITVAPHSTVKTSLTFSAQ